MITEIKLNKEEVKMKLKKIVKLLLLLLPITLFFGSRSEASSLPDVSGDNSLTVNMIYKDGKEKIGIGGAEIKISKVAGIELNPELAIENIAQIKDLKIDWLNLTAEESNILAKKISKLLVGSDVESKLAVTDNSGKVNFFNLENGIYLVEEVSKTGEAMKYSKIEPFFVSLPQNSIGENGEVTWKKSIIAYPKTEIEKIKDDRPEKPEAEKPEGKKPEGKKPSEKQKPRKGPKTGDDFTPLIYCMATGLAVTSLLVIRRKSKNS